MTQLMIFSDSLKFCINFYAWPILKNFVNMNFCEWPILKNCKYGQKLQKHHL